MRTAKRQIRRLIWTVAGILIAGWLYSGGAATVADMLGASEVVNKIKELDGKSPAKSTAKPSEATVARVVDGDTIEVRFRDGRTADVRLIGYDTPESKRPGVPVEQCALEAAAFTKKLAEGKPVKLVLDPSQDKVDSYGRLLRYARIDGKDLGRTVIAAGWGAPYVYDDSNPPMFTDAYRKTAQAAKEKRKGVWGLCEGNFHSEADQPWSGD